MSNDRIILDFRLCNEKAIKWITVNKGKDTYKIKVFNSYGNNRKPGISTIGIKFTQ